MRRRSIYALQSAYYLTTGVWPLVSIDTFMAVTGRKTDVWLVKMVAALVVVNGLALGWAAAEDRSDDGLMLVFAAANTVAFTAIDVIYVARRTIRPIYLADAVAELALLAALAVTRGA